MRKSTIKFDANALHKQLFQYWAKEQSIRLIEYAKGKIVKIGELIQWYHSRNQMDRTGNLLDSLCWVLTYEGRRIGYGFYREQKATDASALHEWSSVSFREKNGNWLENISASEEVYGRRLAMRYIKSKSNNKNAAGWKLYFAILAPYWGYWEEGFTLKTGGGNSPFPRNERFVRFAVMTQYFDQVSRELKPARTRFSCSVPSYTSFTLRKQAQKNFEGK